MLWIAVGSVVVWQVGLRVTARREARKRALSVLLQPVSVGRPLAHR